MVYTMHIYVDGGCRRNGKPGAIGAAAAVFKFRRGRKQCWTLELPNSPTPTNQRAEITAIIIAQKQALELYGGLDRSPTIDVTIHSDSRYAVNCMNEWVYKWIQTNWINAAGREVANRDLIEEASDLDDRLKELGGVKYFWIPRDQNSDADELCNQVMNKMENKRKGNHRTPSWDSD